MPASALRRACALRGRAPFPRPSCGQGPSSAPSPAPALAAAPGAARWAARRFGSRVARALVVAALLAAGALVPASARAADAEGRFVTEGAGRMRCSAFLKAEAGETPAFIAAYGWLDGYATALNTLRPDTFDITPWQTTEVLLLKLSAHCRDNPDRRIGDAAAALFRSLDEDRLRRMSPLAEVRNGRQKLAMYQEVLSRVHRRLVALGYLEPLEGRDRLGPALARFQADRGLATSALPDQPTLNALFP